ncbi:MAG: NfeD family protein [Planctomycetota bacterium]
MRPSEPTVKRIAMTITFLMILPALIGALSGQDATDPGGSPTKTAIPERAVLFPLEGPLAQTMAMRFKRCVDLAESLSAKTLIVEINTPGGEITLMEQLRDLIFEAFQKHGLHTVAYINSNADSAGALLAMACRGLFMSPLAHIGSATPVATNPLAPLAPLIPGIDNESQKDMMLKVKSRARAIFRATAIETNRNSDIAEAMVDPDIELVLALVEDQEQIVTRQKLMDLKSQLGENKVLELSIVSGHGDLLNMTAREGLEWGFIDGIPESRETLLTEFLGIDLDELYIVDVSWSESLVNFLESIHYILLIIGVILLYMEFQIPGFGIPGIAGLSCLSLLFFGKYMVGLAEFTELLIILGGMGLLAVELFLFPGTLVAGILGGLMILIGVVLAFQPFIMPNAPWETDMLIDNLSYLSLSVVIVFVSSMILSRYLPRTFPFRRFVLESDTPPETLRGSAGSIDDIQPGHSLAVGDPGVAKSLLRPSGKVLIGGTLIDAQSEGGFIEKGENIKIVRITGNMVVVRKSKS